MHSGQDSGERGIAPATGVAADGGASAQDALFAALYAELHRLAHRELSRQGGAGTLSPTTLLHEAYLGMARRQSLSFPDRPRFMAYSARVMRGIIVDHARNRSACKRGGAVAITSLKTDVTDQAAVPDEQIVEISDLLDGLAVEDPPLAEIVDLKFYCGFSVAEIAALRGVSERTVQRDWEKARAYLHLGLRGSRGG